MPISVPRRRNAFVPIGKLRGGAYGSHGKHGTMASLNLTPMVDMFTTLVIFLIQLFSASGDMIAVKDLKVPTAMQSELLSDRGPMITLFKGQVLLDGKLVARAEDMDEAENGIGPLSEALTKIRAQDEKIFGRDPNKPFDGKIMIQADKETDFMLVRKTIFSINEAGWAHLNFIVLGDNAKKMAEASEAAAAAQ